jgi:flagellar hook-basal body complex protein FliE
MAGDISSISRLVPGLIEKPGAKTILEEVVPGQPQASFTETFSNMLNSVNDLQQQSSQMQQSFMAGEPVELHDVMIRAQEAGLTMDLMLEIRNKLLNAYNEIMRMPV